MTDSKQWGVVVDLERQLTQHDTADTSGGTPCVCGCPLGQNCGYALECDKYTGSCSTCDATTDGGVR